MTMTDPFNTPLENLVFKTFFLSVVLFLTFTCVPATQASKNAGGLHLNYPVESPTGVHLCWTGGSPDATYSIYRRLHGYDYWERVALNLQGVQGSFDVPGFTLDRTYDYEIRAEEP